MQIVFYILVIATILGGLALAGYGVYGLVKGEVYVINKFAAGIKVSGKLGRKYSFFYIMGGILWVFYAILRLVVN